MLSAPVNETTNEMTRSNASPVSQNSTEVSRHDPRASGFVARPGRAIPEESQPPVLPLFARAQSIYGNQAVLRMLNRSAAGTVLQRKCACEGSGEDCSACAEKKEGALHRVASNQAAPASVPPIVHEVMRSPGRPLDPGTRAFMEPRFGFDFSGVRIHSDAKATESAQAVNALAYTVGNHIVLGAGQYAPQTNSTQRLLAHELAHVVQQSNSSSFQGFRISKPGDPLERQAALAEAAVMSDGPAPALSMASSTLQRQACDPLDDPLCEKQKKLEAEKKKQEEESKLDEKTRKVYAACPDTCRKFLPVEIAPDVFVTLCDDTLTFGPPFVNPVGCTPGRLGMIGFFSGSPAAWKIPAKVVDEKGNPLPCTLYSYCTPHAQGQKPPDTSKIEIGYIQTIEKCLSGGVYYKKVANKWVWAGNYWECLTNVRDGQKDSTAPWYGNATDGYGPTGYAGCPVFADNPYVRMPSGQNIKCIDNLYDRPEWPLRRLRIDGIFHVWLIARVNSGSPIFIHHWSIQDWVVAELKDDGDPCNTSAWNTSDMKKLISSGPGKGSATPVLTGDPPAKMDKKKKDCSAPPGADLKDQPCGKASIETTEEKKEPKKEEKK